MKNTDKAKNAWVSHRLRFSMMLSTSVLCAGSLVYAQSVPVITQPLRELTNPGTHTNQVLSVSFSPKSKLIVTTGNDQAVKIWDATGGLRLVVNGVVDSVRHAVLSPNEHDLLLITHMNSEVWVMPLPNIIEQGSTVTIDFKKQKRKWKVSSNRAICASFSPNGERIAVSNIHGKMGVVDIWSQTARKKLFTFDAHKVATSSVSFSADGNRILTTGFDGIPRVWDASKKTLLFTVNNAREMTNGVFAPDDSIFLINGNSGGDIQIRDAQNGALLRAFKGGHRADVTTVALSPDGTRIVTASEDETVRVWDANTGAVLTVLQGQAEEVTSAAFLSDAQHVVTAGRDGTARLWDLTQPKPIGVALTDLTLLPAHSGPLESISLSDRWVVTAGVDNVVRVWDRRGIFRMLVHTGIHQPTGILGSCVFSPNQHHLALQIAKYVEEGNGHEYREITRLIPLPPIPAQGPAVTVDINELKDVWQVEGNHPAFSPDGQRLAVAKEDGTVEVWSLSNKTKLTTLIGHSRDSMLLGGAPVYSIKFSANGSRIVTGGDDDTAYVWDANTGTKQLSLAGHTDPIVQIAFSSDGSQIVTASQHGTARVWNAKTGASVLARKGIQEDWVVDAAFVPNGKQFVTVGESGSIYVYDAQTGRLLQRMAPVRKSFVTTLAVTSNEIYAGHQDGRVLVWPLPETAQPAQ